MIFMLSDIWFGIHAPPEGRNFDDMKSICKTVEESGFNLFTITDHLMNMRNPNGPNNHPLECWTTLAGLAAVTNKIKLGPLVSCYGYRRPTVLAKMATTVDIISNGRLIFGIGAGSNRINETEFKGFFGRFPPAKERLRGLRETVKICKKMFTNERTTYHGKLYQVDNVLNSPKPIQRPIPIMVGGGGEEVTLKIAAEYADISHFNTRNLDDLERKISALKGHCRAIGRDYDEIRKGTSMSLLMGNTMIEAEEKLKKRALSSGTPIETLRNQLGAGFGTPKNVTDCLKDYVKRGMGLLTFRFHDIEDVQIFSKVIPQF